ncbi:MAG TPA: long-chain-fatty-acid--CoA ligase [Pseudogracilibacillus sp.]|nr:long-chain-fatty-acid--CoA ligase [Pseudogracilibacillus sp.]
MRNTVHFDHWLPRVPKTLTVPETTLFDNLLMTVQKYPDKVAIEYYGASMTYSKLLDEVEKLAGYLESKLNIQKGENVLLFMQNSPQFIISMFAILRIRAVVVPINPMSITSELEFFVEDGNIKHALIGQELYEKTAAPLVENKVLEQPIIAAYSAYTNPDEALGDIPEEVQMSAEDYSNAVLWSDVMKASTKVSAYSGKSSDTAVIPYTSGTTGIPKGCIHTNKTIQANVFSAYFWMSLTPDSVPLTTLPLFHVTGVLHSALAPILAGSKMVLLTRWDRDYAVKAIEKFRCTDWINISTMLIDFLSNPELSRYDISSLGIVGGGGAPVPEAVGRQLTELTGLEYVEGYGLSETMSHTHFNPPQRPKLQCFGVPAFDVDARVIDPSTNKELGANEEGELIVNGPQLFKGYYNRPKETEESHMTIDGKSFFRTGDIVKMDEEGYFFIVDRLKRMINASGYKVWPTEVESILFKHPAIQQACVVRKEDPKRGETVKALVILNDDYKNHVTEKEIIEWSKDQMAAYKYPRTVEFRESFPTTASGKVLWKKLQEEV